jgi:hypothetical protein
LLVQHVNSLGINDEKPQATFIHRFHDRSIDMLIAKAVADYHQPRAWS